MLCKRQSRIKIKMRHTQQCLKKSLHMFTCQSCETSFWIAPKKYWSDSKLKSSLKISFTCFWLFTTLHTTPKWPTFWTLLHSHGVLWTTFFSRVFCFCHHRKNSPPPSPYNLSTSHNFSTEYSFLISLQTEYCWQRTSFLFLTIVITPSKVNLLSNCIRSDKLECWIPKTMQSRINSSFTTPYSQSEAND